MRCQRSSSRRQCRTFHVKTESHQHFLAGGNINERVQKRWAYTDEARRFDPRNEKFDCPCGGKYTTQNKAVHERTARHQRLAAQNAGILDVDPVI